MIYNKKLFFSTGSHLTYENILDIGIEFCKKRFSVIETLEDLELGKPTVVQWYSYFCQVSYNKKK